MSNARFGSGALLGLTLVGALVGLGVGYLLAPGPQAETQTERIDGLRPGLQEQRSEAAPPPGDMQLPASGSAASRDLASAAAADGPGVSDARLQDAIARIDLPGAHSTGEAGAGLIRGEVLDPTGAPIPGVTLIASRRESRGSSVLSNDTVGKGPPEDTTLEQALAASAQSWASSRDRRVRLVSGPDGRFELSCAADQTYDFRAFKEGWVITASGSRSAQLGDELGFRGTRVHLVTLDVRNPDGSAAEQAVIEITTSNRPIKYAWSAEQPALRVGTDRFLLTAHGDTFERPDNMNKTASLSKSGDLPVDLNQQGEEPLLVQLEQRNGIRGVVLRSWNSNQGDQVMIIPIASIDSFDPKHPPQGGLTTYARDGRFLALDLGLGLHAVGLQGKWSGTTPGLLHSQIVEVTGGLVDVELNIPEPKAGDHLVVHCLDPKGQSMESIAFRLQTESSNGSSSSGVRPIRAPDGAYWLPTEDLGVKDFDHWPADTSITLTATSSVLGAQTAQLVSGQRDLTLNFSRPVSLTVHIAGYAERDQGTSLIVRVVDPDGGRSSQPIAQIGQDRMFGGGGERISNDGTVVFPTISPGNWKVELASGDMWGRGEALDSVPITIGSTDATAQLNLPRMYELVVFAPSLKEGAYLRLLRTNSDRSSYTGAGQRNLDENLRCRFTGLVAGTYEVSGAGIKENLAVSVPGPEVVFGP